MRTLLPRIDNWDLRSSLDLMLSDIIYMTDSLDFSKILFDDSRKTADKFYKKLVLCTLAYTSCFFCLNVVYRPAKIHIKYLYSKKLSKLEEIELKLFYDPFIRFLVPNLFYELPMTIARLIIFYGYRSLGWENFTFLLKNIVCVFLTMAAYFEVKTVQVDGVFYSNTSYNTNSNKKSKSNQEILL